MTKEREAIIRADLAKLPLVEAETWVFEPGTYVQLTDELYASAGEEYDYFYVHSKDGESYNYYMTSDEIIDLLKFELGV